MCTYRRPVIAAALLALLAILDCLVSASPAQARGPTLTVELHSASGAAVGRVVFTAQSSNAQGSKVALAFRGCSYVPNGCGEVVLRPGSCAHPALGRGFNISAGWPIGYPLTKLAQTTWAVEYDESDWVARGLTSQLGGCGDHIAGLPLPTNRTPAPTTKARVVRRMRAIVITTVPDRGRITLRPLQGGAHTQMTIEFPDYSGSSEDVARVRPGTCTKLLPAREIAFRLWPDVDDGTSGRTLTLPIAFRRFAREHFVFEHAGTWMGDGVDHCVQLSP